VRLALVFASAEWSERSEGCNSDGKKITLKINKKEDSKKELNVKNSKNNKEYKKQDQGK